VELNGASQQEMHSAIARAVSLEVAALAGDPKGTQLLPAFLASEDATPPTVLRVQDSGDQSAGNSSEANESTPYSQNPRTVLATWATQTKDYCEGSPGSAPTAPNPDQPLSAGSRVSSTSSLIASEAVHGGAIIAGLCVPSAVTRATTDPNFSRTDGSGGQLRRIRVRRTRRSNIHPNTSTPFHNSRTRRWCAKSFNESYRTFPRPRPDP
jgi:hypothetical protein